MASQPSTASGPSREKRTSIPGNIIFVALRLLDIPFQLWILSYSLPSPNSASTRHEKQASSLALPLHLSTYHRIVFAIVCVTSLRHVYWKLFLSEQLLKPKFALVVGLFNGVANALNVHFALWGSPSLSGLHVFTLTLALTFFTIGSLVETASETSRKAYKINRKYTPLPRLYTQQLFAVVRHPNYGGYLLWRTAFALFCGGWVWGGVVACYFMWYFRGTAVPALEVYMERSYGQQWKTYTQRVKYVLLPGIY